jgi:hypothetical protein
VWLGNYTMKMMVILVGELFFGAGGAKEIEVGRGTGAGSPE